jgi:hypothetical protein
MRPSALTVEVDVEGLLAVRPRRRRSPSMKHSGSTPMPTRFERWMRSNDSEMTALDAQEQRALGGPVTRRAHAVVLAREHDQRRAFLLVVQAAL